MYRVFACITQEHHYGLLALAVTICIVGSTLTVLLLRRMIKARGYRAAFLCTLSSIIGGTTIWSTHFIAMLAYDPGTPHSYAFGLTFWSLGVAAVGMLASNALLTLSILRWRAPLAGVCFGLTVSAMHYVGMTAYRVPGELIWEPGRVAASVAAGAIFGAIAFHRILHPNTRYCWMGGALGLILAISSMHFTGMTSFTVFLDSAIDVPAKTLSDLHFGLLVTAVTATLFLLGFTSLNIELNLESEARRQLRHAAMHDQLTGLPNRLKLSSVLDDTTERMQNDPVHKAAVLSIDLDGFKQVNDIHGHAAGDAVLAKTAQRLFDALQQGEFIARTGGDKFVVIKQAFRRTEEVAALGSRLHAAIRAPIDINQTQILLDASIGIANSVNDGQDMEVLMTRSDQAMYQAMLRSDTHICEFNADLDRKTHERKALIEDLRQAIPKGQLELVFQLQNSVETLRPVGFESLLRWNHPERGRVPPNVFIPLAEETGLIQEIGVWVLRTACQTAATWPHPFSVAVNVAPQQLVQSSFVEHVSDILLETALPPHRLELEVTESSMIDDQDNTQRVMHELKAMGLRIAMDDFGTGYSSLATLQAFPFDKIKIDRSFVTDVHKHAQRAAIVRSTLLLGAALDIPVLAEGVETQEELDFLQAENCASVQGFFFGKPMSTAEVDTLMASLPLAEARAAG